MASLNYAQQYSQALANAFPYVLNFGALYATPNNGRYRIVDAKTIQIPRLTTTGRVNADRDTIGTASRNYDNDWETKTLSNQRKWSTLVHPMDIIQTNMVTSISNITKTFNEFQKFPEMDAYTVSKIYSDWIANGGIAQTDTLTTSNILDKFDALMLQMDNARVPANGRLLYVTNEIKLMLKQAMDSSRRLNGTDGVLARDISRIDEVQIIGVPSTLMRTAYNFTTGWAVANGADQINMMLIHPGVVITPVSYAFSQLEAPSAMSEGKYVYYEESFEDVFILNKQAGGIQFNVSAVPLSGLTVTTAAGSSAGNTVATVTGTELSGTSLFYKVSDAKIDLGLGTVISTSAGATDAYGWTSLTSGSTQITAAATKYVNVVEATTADSKALKGGAVLSTPHA